jgi:hypothetical protein
LLGEWDKARQASEQAALWMVENQPDNEDQRRFRHAAAELVGIGDIKNTKP